MCSRDASSSDVATSRFLGGLHDAYLLENERVLWWGQPNRSWRHLVQALPNFILALIILLGAASWIVGALEGKHNRWDGNKAVPPFALHNIALAVLVGVLAVRSTLPFLFGPFASIWRLGRVRYALTEQRAIIATLGVHGNLAVKSYWKGEFAQMYCLERGDGSGDLIFQGRWDDPEEPAGFLRIDSVRNVEQIVRTELM